MTRYVWLDPNYEFSDSWTDKEENDELLTDEERIQSAIDSGWRLIKYECVTHPDFEFTKYMKIK